MSDPIPPGGPERSKRRAILALASGAVVFLCVLVGVSVWMIRGFLNQPEQTLTIPEAASKTPPPMVAAPAQGNSPVTFAQVVAANPANGNLFTIGGIVNNEDGNPVGNATVQLNYTSSTPPPGARTNAPPGANVRYGNSTTVHTDLQGHWTAPNIPKDGLDSLFLQVASREYATTPITTPPRSKLLDQTAILVISKGVDLAGSVVDSAGNAVAGADVVLRQRFAARNGNTQPSATTDADGKFVIPRVAPGQTVPLIVTKSGLAPAFQSITVTAGGPALTIKMQNPRDITGRVTDSSGKGIDGATVQLSNWHNQPRTLNLSTTTNLDGNFTLHDAPADDFSIQANKQGYQFQGTQVQAGSAPVNLVLTKLITMNGSVVDAVTHDPIQQFTVITGAKFTNNSTISFQTGGHDYANGTYSQQLAGFGGVGIDAWYVKIQAKGYLPALSTPLNDSGSQNFELQPAKDITGRVLDAAGQPVAGAIVAISDPTQPVQLMNGTLANLGTSDKTSADGQFDLPPQNGKFTLLVIADQGLGRSDQTALAQSSDIHLTSWGRVEGKLTAKELSGQQMQLRMNSSAQTLNVYAQTTTDDTGAFAFERVPAGDYAVTHIGLHQMANGATQTETLQIVLTTISSGKTSSVAIGGQGRTITGRVADAAGAPIDSADVRIYSQTLGFLTTQTDAQGQFEITDVPLSPVTLTISKSGYLSQNANIAADESRRDMTLALQPIIRGAVTDAATHQPISGFTLRIGMIWATGQPPQYQNQNPQQGNPVFANGQYQVALDDKRQIRNGGGWVVRVEAKGYLPMVSPVLSDSGIQNFELQPSADLKGTILDPAGNPAAGVTVALVISGDQVTISNGNIGYNNGEKLQTGTDGQFDFPPQTGKYAIVAAGDAGFAQADQDALAASPQVHLAPWGRIEGVAKVGSKPAAGAQISAQYAVRLLPNEAPRVVDAGVVAADADGHFVFERIAAGDLVLNLMFLHRQGNTMHPTSGGLKPAAVVSGQNTEVTIGGDGRALTGRAILPAGAGDWKNYQPRGQIMPVPATPPQMPADIKAAGMQAQQLWTAAFAMTPDGKEFMQKQSQAPVFVRQVDFSDDGTFRIDDVLPGDYTLNVFAPPSAGGRTPHTQPVQFTMPALTPELKDKPLELPDIVMTLN